MPKPQSSNPNADGPSFKGPRHQPRWLTAGICLILGLFLTVAFMDYEPAQYTGYQAAAASVVENGAMTVKHVKVAKENLVGPFGVYSTYWSYCIVGGGAWLIPCYLLWTAFLAVRASRRFAGVRMIVMFFSVLACAALWDMQDWFLGNKQVFPHGPGGVLGNLIHQDIFHSLFGSFGAATLLIIFYVLSMMFVLTKDIGAEFDKIGNLFAAWRQRRAEARATREEERKLLREAAARERAKAAAAAQAPADSSTTKNPFLLEKKLSLPKTGSKPPMELSPTAPEPKPTPAEEPKPVKPAPIQLPPSQPKPIVLPEEKPAKAKEKTETATSTRDLAANAGGMIELNIVKPEETKKARLPVPQTADSNYEFPPLKLLREQAQVSAENSEEEHRRNAENLLRILSEFGVEVSLGEIHVGPVITRYEVAPAPGVRVEKIAGLDKNIALGMRAQSVRIQAPIPGKAAVGVEVPNQHPTPVGLREILESEDWGGAKAEIPIALGKDVSGKPLISDLTKMPHLLIAGATGSGKSVCINSIIGSIVYSKSPKDLRLILVDPKVVELKVFNALPHMLIPVVTEPKKVPAALKWLLREMEQRYQIFAKCNVRNITGFNTRKKAAKPEEPPPEAQGSLEGLNVGDDIEIPERLPYIVAIIDELADLMMVAPAEIETSIARLAQLARAAGIHLIIATQRPSVNVITGVIKANLPSRIAFQVASQVDSRTIIDTKGADTLIGRGDMLFTPPGSSRLVRAQGAFVGDEEISEVVEFLKRNGPPSYAQDVQEQIDSAAAEDDEEEMDEGSDPDDMDDEALYRKAIQVLKATRRASTSMLQRRLKIGYNRAARIMELMEERGVVGPENGSSPREILSDLDSL